ncbi:E3 ubiquitin/ISG15 ligase TRIM25-like [Pyxicephalus adspersus]|uniref:E3 ubiquitin/ISG15 ligase TRIM25-like n=1 Tax=Pyxicephalus adspersus TaxID=30357 RepID=UPI003B5C23BE
MAATGVRAELECPICGSIFTDPVNLTCGHNFCNVCIDCVLDTQEGSGGYSCPECRAEFQDRPALQRNITLRNIVDALKSSQPDQSVSVNFCTYCIDFPVSAVKSCLMCESHMCDDHLKVHSRSPEHVLTEPTTSMEKRKCSIHKKILEYYCPADAACICVSCSLAGDHQGHKVEMLDEASEKKKQRLSKLLPSLITKREETEKKVQNLEKQWKIVQEKAVDTTGTVITLFRDLRRQLEDLEKRVLSEISRQEEQLSLSLSDMIQQLEIKKDELSRKMGHIEELCNMTDPLTVLQESHTWDLCDTEDGDDEDRERLEELLHDGRYLNMASISHTLYTELSNIISTEYICFNIQEAADIVLDRDTAHSNLLLSKDMKIVLWSDIKQNVPEKPKRFQNRAQVLSSQRFSSGRHYWDVIVSKSDHWIVGMCYPSMVRAGWDQSRIGKNSKSWGLLRHETQHVMVHNNKEIQLPSNITINTLRVYLDYEAGQLSFYNLCKPIQHLHTFTISFTEPLHAVIWLLDGGLKISGGRKSIGEIVPPKEIP